jgi:uncharacterized membrane protein
MNDLKSLYLNVMTTVIAGILMWYGNQMFSTAVKLSRIENDIIHIRADFADFKHRLDKLEEYVVNDEARLQARVPPVSQ